jgi:CubicO group peptidase (beta-lactamase class C family)
MQWTFSMIRSGVNSALWALTIVCLTSCAAVDDSNRPAKNDRSDLQRKPADVQKEASSADGLEDELNFLLPRILDAYAVPGAAVGIIRGGKVWSATGYGYRDTAKGEPTTVSTAFNVGSISKSVTAWGVMRLVQEGRIELDAPVSGYLSRWKIPPSEFNHEAVTVRRLLNHTAGFSMWGVPKVSPEEDPPSLDEMLVATTDGERDIRLIREPGSEWGYSGGGYAVLQLLIEEVTHRPFDEYMKEEILRPLGMTGSAYVWDEAISLAAATPHDSSGKSFAGQRFTATSAAGLQTTLTDLLAFAMASLNSANQPTRILVSDTVASMQLPSGESPSYGLGYELPEMEGVRLVGHSGSNEGWMALLLLSPDTGDGIVILTNGTNGLRIISEVECAWLLEVFDKGCDGVTPLPVAVAEQELHRYTGRYQDSTGAVADIVVNDGHLFWRTDYGYDFALRSRGKDEFFWVIGKNRVTFQENSNRTVTGLIQHRGDESKTFKKMN